jgi:hypothetical protein
MIEVNYRTEWAKASGEEVASRALRYLEQRIAHELAEPQIVAVWRSETVRRIDISTHDREDYLDTPMVRLSVVARGIERRWRQ